MPDVRLQESHRRSPAGSRPNQGIRSPVPFRSFQNLGALLQHRPRMERIMSKEHPKAPSTSGISHLIPHVMSLFCQFVAQLGGCCSLHMTVWNRTIYKLRGKVLHRMHTGSVLYSKETSHHHIISVTQARIFSSTLSFVHLHGPYGIPLLCTLGCEELRYLGEDLSFVDPSEKLAHYFGMKSEDVFGPTLLLGCWMVALGAVWLVFCIQAIQGLYCICGAL